MVAPGGTVVVSVVRIIVLGGRDGGGHSTVIGRVVNEMIIHIYIHYILNGMRYTIMHDSCTCSVITVPPAALTATTVIL